MHAAVTPCPTCGDLRDRVALAEERVRQLTAALSCEAVPLSLQLNSGDTAILSTLLRQRLATIHAISLACELAPGAWREAPSDDSIRTRILYLRRRLAPFGIAIENRRGEGYLIPEPDKRRLREMDAAETEREAA